MPETFLNEQDAESVLDAFDVCWGEGAGYSDSLLIWIREHYPVLANQYKHLPPTPSHTSTPGEASPLASPPPR